TYEFDWPVHDHREKEALLSVLERKKWFNGEEVIAFEKAYAEFQGAAFGVACTSGTTAIEIVLEALEIGPGDEVIVPPYTFVATATAVLRVGATPVFADVDASWCMDPAATEAAITSKTKAIMPVHFGGSMANIEALKTLAEQHNIELIEDACHAWGSQLKGQGASTIGHCGVFSFQESKNITAGEGGIIVTNDEDLAARCRSIVNCGREEGAAWYHHINLGTNARLTEFGAALLRVQLERYPEQMAVREARAATLDAGLGAIPGIIPQPSAPTMTRRSYHLYCIRFDEEQFGMDRDTFLAAVDTAGLPVVAGYPLPLYKQPLFQKFLDRHDYNACQCPVTEALCASEGLWVQQTMLLLSESHMTGIVDSIASIQAGSR
ncbi:MAG: DegT/DnrJ/EryC1/StrS family aminotransferase, partial [Candidatus Hydrogenedentes bacterium]|nr:DegT/DnrJ/EryC1/StrS family aminotransferase [Candidatus Hydrogenedentota bacterium]